MKYFYYFLILLLISSSLISQEKSTLWKNGFDGDIINVKAEGAKGDGYTDDTEKLQSALDKIYNRITGSKSERGGAIYFPPGIYIISRPLRIPPRCIVFGRSGTFTQSGLYKDITKAYMRQPVVIRLSENSNCNMVEPYMSKEEKFVPYEAVIIEGISFDGNLDRQTQGYLKGIYIPDQNREIRPNFTIRNAFILRVKGWGIYCGKNVSECLFENVFSDENERDGFFFDTGCQDVSFSRAGSGGNKQNGFSFNGCGSFRFINCDSWGNGNNGLYILNSFGFSFDIITCDLNYHSGARIEGSGLLSFINANFSGNSRINREKNISAPQYPEVDLVSNSGGYGVYGSKFISCRFGSMDSTQKTIYAIRDNAEFVRSNSLIGCTFISGSFSKPAIGNPKVENNYIIQGCTGGVDGHEEITGQTSNQLLSARGSVQTDIALSKNNNVLLVNTSENNVSVQLPGLNEIPEGKEFIIIKTDKNNEITVKPRKGDLLNGQPDSKQITGEAYSERKIINAGNTWVLVN